MTLTDWMMRVPEGRKLDSPAEGVIGEISVDGNDASPEALAVARECWPEGRADDFERFGKRDWRDRATGIAYKQLHGCPLLAVGSPTEPPVAVFFVAGGRITYLARPSDLEEKSVRLGTITAFAATARERRMTGDLVIDCGGWPRCGYCRRCRAIAQLEQRHQPLHAMLPAAPLHTLPAGFSLYAKPKPRDAHADSRPAAPEAGYRAREMTRPGILRRHGARHEELLRPVGLPFAGCSRRRPRESWTCRSRTG